MGVGLDTIISPLLNGWSISPDDETAPVPYQSWFLLTRVRCIKEEMQIGVLTPPLPHEKYRVRNQNVDGDSEIAPLESGISQ